jgi:glycosyltransferase involved in cell wall biosynthesis
MLEAKRIAVVVPAYNEARLIGRVLATMPGFVDEIVVVDDGSDDDTASEIRRAQERRPKGLSLIRHLENRGVGAAIRTGYRFSLAQGADVVAVMAGDGQMDPADLLRVVTPVVRGEADYAKGDRLVSRSRPPRMPRARYYGIEALTRLTRIAAGYADLHDSQSGYTAISSACLRAVPLSMLHAGYGYPNHLLILLGAARRRVVDVPVRAVYGEGETSKLRCWRVAPRLALILGSGYLWRVRRLAQMRRRVHERSVEDAGPLAPASTLAESQPASGPDGVT